MSSHVDLHWCAQTSLIDRCQLSSSCWLRPLFREHLRALWTCDRVSVGLEPLWCVSALCLRPTTTTKMLMTSERPQLEHRETLHRRTASRQRTRLQVDLAPPRSQRMMWRSPEYHRADPLQTTRTKCHQYLKCDAAAVSYILRVLGRW